jgi:endonuclease/exonuclease/phosphatase family metal-dependent hydrolase
VLKVLTLNLWNDQGPYERRRERVREWIERLDPDVIGFQEVLKGNGSDTAAAQLPDGYHVDFAAAIPFWLDPSVEFGNAIASRWPISDREVLTLPEHGDETRVALSVTIDAPFGPVCFSTTHLNWKLHHGMIRERQVVALGEMVLKRRPRNGFPPIVVGDFNAEPDSSEIRYMSGFHAIDGNSVQFYDAWRVAGDGGPGYTWSNRNAYASIALEPERRIDYIFVGYPVRLGDAYGLGHIERCMVVCDDERDGVWPSDHFGVYAELRTDPLPVPEVLQQQVDRAMSLGRSTDES